MKNVVHAIALERVICMPSDTVYGLMCSARSQQAVRWLYKVKGREGKPGTIIVDSTKQLVELGFDEEDLKRAKVHWPGPVSVVIPAPPKLSYLHMGLESLAVRIPGDDKLRALLNTTGPLATTSANRPGEPTVTTIQQAKDIFGDNVAVYVNGGQLKNPPSTILKLTVDGFERLRG